MIIALFRTSSYEFIGVGASVEHARLALRDAWAKHQKERPGTPDFDEATSEEFWGSPIYRDVVPGAVLRAGGVVSTPDIFIDPRGLVSRCAECGKSQTPNSPNYANHFRGCSLNS